MNNRKEMEIMNKIKLPQAARLTSPNPVTLVCTQRPDSSTNLATVSWWTYLSFHPNMIAYAMAKTSYSGEMVRNNKKVILTIPGAEIAEAVMGCGSTTGRDTDKADGQITNRPFHRLFRCRNDPHDRADTQ